MHPTAPLMLVLQVDIPLPSADAGQQAPSSQLAGRHTSEAATTSEPQSKAVAELPQQHTRSIHLHEAKAWCPEGAELSEAYNAPLHVPGANGTDSDSWAAAALQHEVLCQAADTTSALDARAAPSPGMDGHLDAECPGPKLVVLQTALSSAAAERLAALSCPELHPDAQALLRCPAWT